MSVLEPKDLQEIERVARAYAAAFRSADADGALSCACVPVVDCVDLGEIAKPFVMDHDSFVEGVREHANEDFTTEVTGVRVEAMGANAALAWITARVRRPNGREAATGWVEFLARTEQGWKVWANWLGPLPAEF